MSDNRPKIILLVTIASFTVIVSFYYKFITPSPTTPTVTESTIKGGLYFQNSTPETLWVAVGYADGAGNWFSRGWVKIEPCEKRRALEGYLIHRYYTYYAHTATNSRFWAGDRHFWVQNQNWHDIPAGLNPTQATPQGFQTKPFRMVDIGHPNESFVITLY